MTLMHLRSLQLTYFCIIGYLKPLFRPISISIPFQRTTHHICIPFLSRCIWLQPTTQAQGKTGEIWNIPQKSNSIETQEDIHQKNILLATNKIRVRGVEPRGIPNKTYKGNTMSCFFPYGGGTQFLRNDCAYPFFMGPLKIPWDLSESYKKRRELP